MREFLLGWTYKKEVAANIAGYTLIGVVGNLLLNRTVPEEDKPANFCTSPIEHIRQLPTRQKVFNGIVLGCFVVDTTVSLLFLKHLKKKLR